MRRNAAVVGGEAVFGVLLKLLLPLGKVLGRAFGGKIFSAGIFPVDILPKFTYIIFEVSFPSDCWVIGTLHYRKTCLTSFFRPNTRCDYQLSHLVLRTGYYF